ncbi:MAG: DNA polymerase II large subunit [Thermoplasmata archaeon]|nr:DNA polymerase II large subunit [Thermoplasmata archaeon]MCI4359572.1 DNA polymerase II large subunit [Thermoplasmata archaeon]
MLEYERAIEDEVDRAYVRAQEARATGIDPQVTVEIPRAQDMAMRVEKLLGHLPLSGISEEIRELAETYPREEVAVTMARRIASDPRRGRDLESRLDASLRVGLAILTEGILVAPLEGLAEVHLVGGHGSLPYVELSYAGPIRAAGGTAQALSVLLADIVRRDLGLGAYVPDTAEVGRYQEEIPLYKHLQHLQYAPTAREIEIVVRHVPVCVSGEATEGDAEVSAFRNLPRVPTNGIRGGACLVLAEGLCQKSAKLHKIVEKLGVPGWEFLTELGHANPDDAAESQNPKYLREAVGGRPVLAYPGRAGGFRLVYGRSRTGGLASLSVNPATMVILRRFIAVGTQVKIELPGKAAAISLCDTVDGPIVELNDGTVTAVHERQRAEELVPQVRRIVDLGELLVPFGEFLENNRPLVAGAYSLDWHLAELDEAGASSGLDPVAPTYSEALETARSYGVPLHPRHLLFWHDVTPSEIAALSRHVERHGRWLDGRLTLPWEGGEREVLTRLGFLFGPSGGQIAGERECSEALVGGLGLSVEGSRLVRRVGVDPIGTNPLALVSRLGAVTVKARGPTRIGARVGRPEKARQRSMSPNVHALFPIGESGGARRSIAEAARRNEDLAPTVQLGVRTCPACQRSTVWMKCACGSHTEPTGAVSPEVLPIPSLWTAAIHKLRLRRVPEVKGVKGLTSPGKVPEMLEKGILRASHGVSVYQDGTSRFDLTDLPLTHFRPAEVGLSIERARSLGYVEDWTGRPLEQTDQLVELRPQDLVVSRSCLSYLVRIAQFVDDELTWLYGREPYYRAAREEDLVGHLVVALAPHTSGGVVGRIIGFSDAEACFAHPVFHAAKRRNCDGDEDSVTLLLDALLNFSRSYLPESRGALMDKPLVLTTRLDLTEVDKEAHNLDVAARYPLALYRAAERGRPAKEVEGSIETLGQRVTRPDPMVGLAFTHDTTDLAGGPVRSAYREAGSMSSIVEESLLLTAQIRAVDLADAVTLVLNAHFLPDLMGNLKSFATQKFRCKKCGTSFRRPPIAGRCTEARGGGPTCGGELLPTVFEGAVRKYLGLSQRLAATPGVTPYVRQRIQILESSLETLFPREATPMPLEGYAPRDPDPPTEGTPAEGESEAPSKPTNTERPLPPTAGL